MNNEVTCCFCKNKVTTFIYHCKVPGRERYACRPCNTERAKRYRATENGGERIRMAVYKLIKKFRFKQNAREKLRAAVRRGKIVKPERCEKCLEKVKVEGHHTDYSQPLNVQWLCKNCHTIV